MDSGGYGRARLSGKARGLLLAVLMAGFATLIAFFVIDVGRGPESNGGRLDDFLNDPKSGKCNFLDSETISWVQGFGPEAIPPLAAAVLNGGRNDEPAMDWLRKLFAMEPVERVKPKVRQRMALASLAALGGKHPKKVDAAYLPLLSTSNRFDAIYWLGLAGPRHFSFLTNLVAGTNFGEAEQAISSLVWMGTNADPAVPLLFSAIERHRENSPRRWWLSILAFRHIGPGHPFTVSRLLEYTEDEHPAVRSHSIFVLSGFTNESSRIIPHFLRLLREGDITRINDTGYSVARKLQGIGTPAHQAFPMLFARLKQAAELRKRIRKEK